MDIQPPKYIEWLRHLDSLLPNQKDSTKGFIENYKSNVKKFRTFNNLYKSPIHNEVHQEKFLRIASWNVRYFTNIDNKPSIHEIVQVIQEINPDILCLNEITLGKNKYYEHDLIFENYLLDYKLISVLCCRSYAAAT